MAKKSHVTIEEIVRDFLLRVQKKIRVESAYWFGSTAHGKGHEYSDIDIAVVSPDFSGFRWDDLEKLLPILTKVDSRIEVHTISSEDFKEGTMMSLEIQRTGKRVV